MILFENGHWRSVRTNKETTDLLEQDVETLSPDERAVIELLMKEVADPRGTLDLLGTIGNLEWVRTPVDMRTFVMDPYYLGNTCDNLYPKLLEDLTTLFDDGYREAIITGAIGFGKTFVASIGICRILYILSCMRDPHRSFGIAANSNISIVCLAGDTEIYDGRTGERLRLDRAEEGERHVIGFDGRCLCSVPSRGVVCTGRKPVFELRTSTGRWIRATAEHEFLTMDKGQMQVKDLRVGQPIALAAYFPGPGEARATLSEAELKLLGYLVSEGNTKNKHVQFGNTDKRLIDEYVEAALEIGCNDITVSESVDSRPNRKLYYNARERAGKRGQRGIVYRLETLCGVHGLLGKGANEKRIPSEVMQQPNEGLALFLNRLYAGDGSIHLHKRPDSQSHQGWKNYQCRYATTSPMLAQDVADALLRFGIYATVRYYEPGGGWNPAYYVEFSRKDFIQLFVHHIGIFGREYKCEEVDWKGFALAAGEVCWDELVAIEPKGEADVYCVRDVERHPWFVANGFITHNCLSINEILATKVAYENIATKIEASPYFQEHFPFEKTKKELRFPHHIWVAARASNDGSVLGLNVISGLLDECVAEDTLIPRVASDGSISVCRAADLPATIDNILTLDGTGTSVRSTAYTKRSSDQVCYELGLDNGMSLTCSGDHPILSRSGEVIDFILTKSIIVGQEVVIYALLLPRPTPASSPPTASPSAPLTSISPCVRVRDFCCILSSRGEDSVDGGRLPDSPSQRTDENCRGEIEKDLVSGFGENLGSAQRERTTRLGPRSLGRELSVAKVMSKRDVGVRPTYDISVPGYECFVADGIVVHNTNFMPKATKGQDPRFNLQDRAEVLYNAMLRRMKSRFERKGRLPGTLFIVSSKQTNTDFTAKRIRESMLDPTVFVRDYSLWAVKPDIYYSGDWFHVVVGNEQAPSRIVGDEEDIDVVRTSLSEDCVVIDVPEDFRADFEKDMEGAIRDLAGVATVAVSPYIQRRTKIIDAIRPDLKHPFSTEIYDPSQPGRFYWSKMVRPDLEAEGGNRPIINPYAPRHVHIDPSLSGDATGFAMGHISGWREVVRRDDEGNRYPERAPEITMDLVLRIIPPLGSEIILGDVRKLVYELSKHGFMITCVSIDSWNSADAIQKLSQRGFNSIQLSVDRTMGPYDLLKTALYENRLLYYDYPPLLQELRELEHDRVKRKVDHPLRGKKDVADAVAGVVWTLAENSSVLPLPMMRSVSDTGDAWMIEHQQAAMASRYGGDGATGERDFSDWSTERAMESLPPFLIGSGDSWDD